MGGIDRLHGPQSARAAQLLGLASTAGGVSADEGGAATACAPQSVACTSAFPVAATRSRSASSSSSSSSDSSPDPTSAGRVAVHGSKSLGLLGVCSGNSASAGLRAVFAKDAKGGSVRPATPPRGGPGGGVTAVPSLHLGALPRSSAVRPGSAREARLQSQTSSHAAAAAVGSSSGVPRPATARDRAKPLRPATALLASAAERERGSTANAHTWALRGVQGGQKCVNHAGFMDPLVAILAGGRRPNMAWVPPPRPPSAGGAGSTTERRSTSSDTRPESAGSDWLRLPTTSRDPPLEQAGATTGGGGVDPKQLLLPAETNDWAAIAQILKAHMPHTVLPNGPEWLWVCPPRVQPGEDPSGVSGRGLAGFSPLHYACSRGHDAAAWLLLRAGFDPSAQAIDKSTPLHSAAGGGHLTLVRMLEAFGARVNTQDDFGETPLHAASKQGNVQCVTCLLAAGASARVVDRLGDTPVDVTDKPSVLRALKLAEAAQSSTFRDAPGVLGSMTMGRHAPAWSHILRFCDSDGANKLRCTSGLLQWLASLVQPATHIKRLSSITGPDPASLDAASVAFAPRSHRLPRGRAAGGAAGAASSVLAASIADPALASFHSKLKQASARV